MSSKKKQIKSKSVSIKKYKNKRELNIGIFLFAVVLIYLIVTVIMYLTGDKLSVYEVREGSIVKDNSYTGLILREETAVNAETGGYISYYQNENSKVKSGANAYAISPEKLETGAGETNAQAAGDISLNQEVQSGIVLQLQNFNENYRAEDFAAVYSLKNELDSTLLNTLSETKTEHLTSVIDKSGQEVSTYKVPGDGIISFSTDGYEGLTKETFTKENFDKSEYESRELKDQMEVSAGEPVYRLVTSEAWSVIVPLEEETAKELKDQEITSVKVRIDKDSETLWADFSVMTKDGDYYGCLDFDNSMIRYVQERYLNIELILEDESGLKIPKSSVVEEEFFVVPEEYITTGGNSSSDGVMVRDNKGNAVFTAVDIFAEMKMSDAVSGGSSDPGGSSDSADSSGDSSASGKEVYLSKDALREGDVLIMPDSSETYTVGETKALKGVYNINKGYAVFKKVTILCESDEYYIVQEGEDYGLSNYDHIVQNGEGVSPDEVVFQ